MISDETQTKSAAAGDAQYKFDQKSKEKQINYKFNACWE